MISSRTETTGTEVLFSQGLRQRSPVPRRSSPLPRRRQGEEERWHHDGEAADAAEAIARKERLEAEQREQQRVADEQKRLEEAEQRRQAQRQRRVELEEQARKAELLRIAEKAEAQKQAELKRQARQAQKAEQQRVEADERRRALEQRLTAQKAEAEQARLEKVRQEEEDALARSRSLQARLSSPASGQPHEASSHRSRSPTHSSDAEPCRGRKRGHDEVRREGSSREPSSSPTRWFARMLARIVGSFSCISCSVPLNALVRDFSDQLVVLHCISRFSDPLQRTDESPFTRRTWRADTQTHIRRTERFELLMLRSSLYTESFVQLCVKTICPVVQTQNISTPRLEAADTSIQDVSSGTCADKICWHIFVTGLQFTTSPIPYHFKSYCVCR